MSDIDDTMLSDEETLGKLSETDLSILIEANQEHMRHVESEKLSFLRIYLAAVSFIMAVVFVEGLNNKVRIYMLTFGIVIGIIVIALSYRWTHVFDNHKKILRSLIEQMLRNRNIDLESEKRNDLNRYFLFNNRKYEFGEFKQKIRKIKEGKDYKRRDVIIFKLKNGHIMMNDDGTYPYVSTGRLISLFVYITLIFQALLIIVLVFFA